MQRIKLLFNKNRPNLDPPPLIAELEANDPRNDSKLTLVESEEQNHKNHQAISVTGL